ncbi:hypothetical protein PV327_004169 [Microctonus hyperodae]|uniref:Uncharacterized protein n=1 Tax=Microctonus hyperodae TaxID=165561 RepID=A0AA39KMD4_MICHY|nr:hypothetical protein PV327_004169 [Microctonus hyperodae]
MTRILSEVIHTQVGRSVTIKGPYLGRPLERCSVEHNGINYGLYPKLNLTGAEFAGSPRFCSFIIKWIDFDHAGEWIIKTIWGWDDYSDDVDNSTLTVNRYTDYTIHVRQDDAELAFEGVTDTESGSYATIHFKDYFNKITKCYIGEIRYILSDNSNGISTGLYRNGKCGVRIPINDEYSGKWELVQESGDDKITTGIFTIWPDSSTKSSEELHKNWRRGSKNKTIRINKYGIHWYCELERPDGMKESLIDSQCEYSVKRVSEEHAGTWKLRYASKYSTNILEQRIVVNVYGTSMNFSVIKSCEICSFPPFVFNLSQLIFLVFRIQIEKGLKIKMTAQRLEFHTLLKFCLIEANKLAFKNVIDGEDGSYIAVFFNEYFHNVTKCYAVKKTDHDEISYILTDNGIASAAELKLHNKCGVQIPLSNEWTGQWTLVQESGSYKIRSGFISIGSQ